MPDAMPERPESQAAQLYAELLLYKWMVTGGLTGEEQAELARRFPIAGRGCVLVLETAEPAGTDGAGGGSVAGGGNAGGAAPAAEWRGMLRQTALRTLSAHAEAAAAAPDHEPRRLYIAAAWKDGCRPDEAVRQLHAAVLRLARVYNRVVSAGIGRVSPRIELDMRGSCDSALEALSRLFYHPPGAWLFADAPDEARRQPSDAPLAAARDAEALELAAAACDEPQALALLAGALDRMAASCPTPFRVKCGAVQLLLGCMKRAESALDEADSRALACRIDQELMASASWLETKAAAERLLRDLIGRLRAARQSRGELIMRKCREYIDAHLHENLGLETVAQRFYYNPSYFSILFKQHVGMPFTDYLVQTRMRKARALLLQSELRVADIAREVGYKDTKYFNKVFKRMFLCSPDEFRRMFAPR